MAAMGIYSIPQGDWHQDFMEKKLDKFPAKIW